MSLNISPITSTPETNRLIRTITRGEFAALQAETEKSRKKQRTYLVATDLSAEAAYALEWTIGTVLRDGDTLLGIYAIDEETVGDNSISSSNIPSETLSRDRPDGIVKGDEDSVKTDISLVENENAEIHSKEPYPTTLKPGTSPPLHFWDTSQHIKSSLGVRSTTPSIPSPLAGYDASVKGISGRDKNKAVQERWHAAETITALVTKLLRKTRLQVNVVVEVIHCKSPKHLLTEMVRLLICCAGTTLI